MNNGIFNFQLIFFFYCSSELFRFFIMGFEWLLILLIILQALFPGLLLTEITLDSYKVEDVPEA